MTTHNENLANTKIHHNCRQDAIATTDVSELATTKALNICINGGNATVLEEETRHRREEEDTHRGKSISGHKEELTSSPSTGNFQELPPRASSAHIYTNSGEATGADRKGREVRQPCFRSMVLGEFCRGKQFC